MTYIFKARTDEFQRNKWRLEAERAAANLRKNKFPFTKELIGFVFDDGIVKVPMSDALIASKTEKELADYLFKSVLDAVELKEN